MKNWVGGIIVAIAIIAAIFISVNFDTVKGWFDKSPETVVEEAPEVEITTYDVVAQRRIEIEVQAIDSIYYTMPEPALIAILDEVGINTSRETIIEQYLSDRRYYDGLTRGATLNRHYAPDSIPRSSTPTKPMPVITDTIRHQITFFILCLVLVIVLVILVRENRYNFLQHMKTRDKILVHMEAHEPETLRVLKNTEGLCIFINLAVFIIRNTIERKHLYVRRSTEAIKIAEDMVKDPKLYIECRRWYNMLKRIKI